MTTKGRNDPMTSHWQALSLCDKQFWELLGPEATRLLKVELDIRTSHDRPPIVDRQFDWSAIHYDTYDGAEDSSTRNHIGYGPTEADAITDLLRLDTEAAEAAEAEL